MSRTSLASQRMNNGSPVDNPAIPETSDPCLEFLGLDHNPFSMAPDIVNFFSSPRIEATVVEVLQLVESRMGFALLYGDVGLGKTTISRRILHELDQRGIDTSLVFNTFFQGAELIGAINRDFGLEAAGADLQSQLSALNEFLLERRLQGRNCVIIIDDAQNLSIESLELIRQISNMETGIDKIVQIILIGQSELEVTLNRHELRQLKSRIVLKRFFKPFSRRESAAYIRSKIARAGMAPLLEIDDRAIRRVHEFTEGFPRRINVVMGRCLYAAVACRTCRVTDRVARMAIADVEETFENRAPPPTAYRGFAALAIAGVLIAVPLAAAYVPNERFDAAATLWRLLPGADRSANSPAPAEPGPSMDRSATHDTRHAQTPVEAAPAVIAEAADERDTPEAVSDVSPDAGPETTPDDRPVLDFLSSYGLAEHLEEFTAAVHGNDFTTVAEAIFRGSGLRLIALPATTALPDTSWNVLFLNDHARADATQLLFWRPGAWRDEDFRFFYRKPQILALQAALKNSGDYDYVVDGIAGERTTRAIDRFQRSHGLRPTGVPDPATLFMLEATGATPDTARTAFRGD